MALAHAVSAALRHVPNGDLILLLKEMSEVLETLNAHVRPGFESEYTDIKDLLQAERP